eukprot:gene25678-biopygen9049
MDFPFRIYDVRSGKNNMEDHTEFLKIPNHPAPNMRQIALELVICLVRDPFCSPGASGDDRHPRPRRTRPLPRGATLPPPSIHHCASAPQPPEEKRLRTRPGRNHVMRDRKTATENGSVSPPIPADSALHLAFSAVALHARHTRGSISVVVLQGRPAARNQISAFANPGAQESPYVLLQALDYKCRNMCFCKPLRADLAICAFCAASSAVTRRNMCFCAARCRALAAPLPPPPVFGRPPPLLSNRWLQNTPCFFDVRIITIDARAASASPGPTTLWSQADQLGYALGTGRTIQHTTPSGAECDAATTTPPLEHCRIISRPPGSIIVDTEKLSICAEDVGKCHQNFRITAVFWHPGGAAAVARAVAA